MKSATGTGFDPENIISDALFYDGNAMSAAEIQAFLDAKVGSCDNGNCLNVLTTGISSRDAWYSAVTGDLVCAAIQGGTMWVSDLIYRVQVACGISAKAILVTLQKEQGLVTSSAPSDWNLRAAMGASCPDTEPCDPAYAGVGPQILKGVQQLKIYKAGRFAKQPGINYIGYSPDSSCGGTNLNIRNYATAALYNYTPYQPNAASLAAGWGLGDGCSSYGNRNFYNYYTSWFGSTQLDMSAARATITARWAAIGGSGGVLGPATGDVTCGTRGGGCYQNFRSGAISWSSSAGAWETYGGIRARWQALGFENGVLGYPVTPPVCGTKDGGCYQNFQSGAISWTPATGSWETYGDLRSRWAALGFEAGVLGYPVGGVTCGTADSGCYQNFQRGAVTWTPQVGAWETYGGIRAKWRSTGFESGVLGYPIGAPVAAGSGVYQAFQNGAIGWTGPSGAFASTGEIGARWLFLDASGGTLGSPTSDVTCRTTNGGCYQNFDNGAISSTAATGAWETYGDIRARWRATGFEDGALGYPVGAPVCGTKDRGCYQNFQNGAISWTATTGAWETYGDIRARWRATGFEDGVLGYPVGAPVCGTKDRGCYQNFQNGAISWTATTGAWETYGDIRAYWKAQNFESGSLGYPKSAPSRDAQGVLSQVFQGGTVTIRASGATVSP